MLHHRIRQLDVDEFLCHRRIRLRLPNRSLRRQFQRTAAALWVSAMIRLTRWNRAERAHIARKSERSKCLIVARAAGFVLPSLFLFRHAGRARVSRYRVSMMAAFEGSSALAVVQHRKALHSQQHPLQRNDRLC